MVDKPQKKIMVDGESLAIKLAVFHDNLGMVEL